MNAWRPDRALPPRGSAGILPGGVGAVSHAVDDAVFRGPENSIVVIYRQAGLIGEGTFPKTAVIIANFLLKNIDLGQNFQIFIQSTNFILFLFYPFLQKTTSIVYIY